LELSKYEVPYRAIVPCTVGTGSCFCALAFAFAFALCASSAYAHAAGHAHMKMPDTSVGVHIHVIKSVPSVTRLACVYYDGDETPRVLHMPRYESHLQ
jgi:hypothetical protein